MIKTIFSTGSIIIKTDRTENTIRIDDISNNSLTIVNRVPQDIMNYTEYILSPKFYFKLSYIEKICKFIKGGKYKNFKIPSDDFIELLKSSSVNNLQTEYGPTFFLLNDKKRIKRKMIKEWHYENVLEFKKIDEYGLSNCLNTLYRIDESYIET